MMLLLRVVLCVAIWQVLRVLVPLVQLFVMRVLEVVRLRGVPERRDVLRRVGGQHHRDLRQIAQVELEGRNGAEDGGSMFMARERRWQMYKSVRIRGKSLAADAVAVADEEGSRWLLRSVHDDCDWLVREPVGWLVPV